MDDESLTSAVLVASAKLPVASVRLNVQSNGLVRLLVRPKPQRPPACAQPVARAIDANSLAIEWSGPDKEPVTTGLYVKSRIKATMGCGGWFWYRVLRSGKLFPQTSSDKGSSSFKGCTQWKHPHSGACTIDLTPLEPGDYCLVASHFNAASLQSSVDDDDLIAFTMPLPVPHLLPPREAVANLSLRVRLSPRNGAGGVRVRAGVKAVPLPPEKPDTPNALALSHSSIQLSWRGDVRNDTILWVRRAANTLLGKAAKSFTYLVLDDSELYGQTGTTKTNAATFDLSGAHEQRGHRHPGLGSICIDVGGMPAGVYGVEMAHFNEGGRSPTNTSLTFQLPLPSAPSNLAAPTLIPLPPYSESRVRVEWTVPLCFPPVSRMRIRMRADAGTTLERWLPVNGVTCALDADASTRDKRLPATPSEIVVFGVTFYMAGLPSPLQWEACVMGRCERAGVVGSWSDWSVPSAPMWSVELCEAYRADLAERLESAKLKCDTSKLVALADASRRSEYKSALAQLAALSSDDSVLAERIRRLGKAKATKTAASDAALLNLQATELVYGEILEEMRRQPKNGKNNGRPMRALGAKQTRKGRREGAECQRGEGGGEEGSGGEGADGEGGGGSETGGGETGGGGGSNGGGSGGGNDGGGDAGNGGGGGSSSGGGGGGCGGGSGGDGDGGFSGSRNGSSGSSGGSSDAQDSSRTSGGATATPPVRPSNAQGYVRCLGWQSLPQPADSLLQSITSALKSLGTPFVLRDSQFRFVVRPTQHEGEQPPTPQSTSPPRVGTGDTPGGSSCDEFAAARQSLPPIPLGASVGRISGGGSDADAEGAEESVPAHAQVSTIQPLVIFIQVRGLASALPALRFQLCASSSAFLDLTSARPFLRSFVRAPPPLATT